MNQEKILLALTRLAIGHSANVIIESVDWKEILVLAEQQGLSAVVLDGIDKIRCKGLDVRCELPDKLFLTQWIGEVLQGYEFRYEQYRRTLVEMAGFYNSHGCKMMVLKGYACCLTWPKPEHRPVGDIDIWLFGGYKKADALLESEKGIKTDKSHHHHTVFYWNGFMVENHYDFINVHRHKINAGIERELKRLGKDDSYFVEIDGEMVYLPSPNLHALFLIKHMMNDFTAFSMSLRQLLDWAFFVKKYGDCIDWKWLKGILSQYHMTIFFNYVNAICVEDLGFFPEMFHGVQFNTMIKDRILNDTIHPKYTANEPPHLLSRLLYKYKRWRGNGWKHNLCYQESMWSAFWSGIWSHILKPSSI